MSRTYILMTIEPGKESQVNTALRRLDEVIEFHAMFGEYDAMVQLEAPTLAEVGRIVEDKLKKIDGVLNTKTLPGINT